MKLWTAHHAALLNALRAERLVPRLYQRLALERYVADEDEMRRLGDWPSALMNDPGWAILEPTLDRPAAWPAAWHQACERGWSPLSDHHHALLFGRLTSRFLRDEEYEHAQWAWTECLGAWRRVLSSAYPEALLADLVEAPADGEEVDPEVLQARRDVIKHLLDDLITARGDELRDALGLVEARQDRSLVRRRARFAWSALDLARMIMSHTTTDDTTPDDEADSFGTMRRVVSCTKLVRADIIQEVLARFDQLCAEVDLNTASADEILAPYEWAAEIFSVLGHHEQSSVHIIPAVVQLGWTLRRMGRDDEQGIGFDRVLATIDPFNVDLERRLLTRTTFGHNSKCADYLVFQGELEKTHEGRKARFERGLKVCPGHRNSAMLLSHERLHDANVLLNQLRLLPAVSRVVPGSSSGAQEKLDQAWALIREAQNLYGVNDSLPRHIERAKEEAARLKLDLDDA